MQVTRNGPAFSAVAESGSSDVAKRSAVGALRRAVSNVVDTQERLAPERAAGAEQAYQRNDADVRSARAAAGVGDIQQALNQRAADLQRLTQAQQAAQQRDPQRAAQLTGIIAVNQQDLFDLRSLSDRLAQASTGRDQAATDLTQAQAAIGHWRSVATSAVTIPVAVRSRAQDPHRALRVTACRHVGQSAGPRVRPARLSGRELCVPRRDDDAPA